MTDDPDAAPVPLAERERRHWAVNWRLTALLLVLWFLASFVITFFARDLEFAFFGWPFSFWMAAQGALLLYLLVIVGYAVAMNRLDREHRLDGD